MPALNPAKRRRKNRRLSVPKEKRSETAEKLRLVRFFDRDYVPFGHAKGGARDYFLGPRKLRNYHIHGTRADYEAALRFFENKLAMRDVFAKKLTRSDRKVNVLDVGCGACVFLDWAGTSFGEKLNLHGLALARPLREKQIDMLREEVESTRRETWGGIVGLFESDEEILQEMKKSSKQFRERVSKHNLDVHVGTAETHRFGKKFDLIFSVETFKHSVNPAQALKNILSQLARGGDAYINFLPETDPVNSRRTKAWLALHGVKAEKLGLGIYHFRKVI